ncbi:MAG: hydroxyproline-2-epimerase [Acidobacteria bacterium]|nr:MAG: hydroxyproline-2-epimerase [Acidobacteriota bacterium]
MSGFGWPDRVEVVDSHTEGEPTRVVVSGWPMPAGTTMAERRADLLARQDRLRQAVACEPRGHDAVVGALLTPPVSAGSAAGVVFFNNAGALWMCGHGLIGVVRTLQHLGRLAPGSVRIDTPAGTVGAELHADGSVTIENVPASCHALDVTVEVPGLGRVTGDVAWGGNWFFLTRLPAPELLLSNVAGLTDATTRILRALSDAGIAGADGPIDHVELFGPPRRPDADSRNFVLCPGLAYDRSPCGTGTSAKMAVLHARGQLAPGQRWRQESITGSLFTGWLEERQGRLVPRVNGRAYVTGVTTLLFHPDDPFREGFTAVR